MKQQIIANNFKTFRAINLKGLSQEDVDALWLVYIGGAAAAFKALTTCDGAKDFQNRLDAISAEINESIELHGSENPTDKPLN